MTILAYAVLVALPFGMVCLALTVSAYLSEQPPEKWWYPTVAALALCAILTLLFFVVAGGVAALGWAYEQVTKQ